MLPSFKKSSQVRWLNCLTGTRGVSKELSVAQPGCSVRAVQGADGLHVEPGERHSLLNGKPFLAPVTLREASTLQTEDALLILAPEEDATIAAADCSRWALFDAGAGELIAECPSTELLDRAAQLGRAPDTLACTPVGMEVGFSLSQAAPLLCPPPAPIKPAAPALAAEQNKGAHVCPVCWTRFDAGDALSVAVHEELRGDPVLGSDARLRFQPTRFNDQGLALDPKGLACTDIACPHCRRQLPPGYLDLPHRIISLIGAPSSGKSYYLAVLTRVLQERLPLDFGLAFRDGDPSGNMLLNQMRSTLFSATTPEEALLGKTALEGATYEKLPRLGKMVSLPRPFIYSVGRPGQRSKENSMIFYDNAGEHFEPGIDIHDSPGAMHVATSSGLIFLFDPTANARFKSKLVGVEDPQLTMRGRVDQQDTILSEMETRIKRVLGLSHEQRIATPLAFVVGKCDTWAHLLPSPLEPVVRDGGLDLAALDRNSDRVRHVLAELCPGLVASAESLASEMRYFAVTSFGHCPVTVESGPNRGRIAPDPLRLAPAHVQEPVYWLLRLASPELIPAAR
ncbi:MAG: hypothetical protein RJA37_193 [Verrucomicrobiota bacterium]|jgi:hypothetical protein